MTGKLAWICCVTLLAVFGAAHLWLSPAVLAVRSVELLGGETTLSLAQEGASTTLAFLLQAELTAALPHLALGVALAIVLRLMLRRWQREQRPATSVTVVDPAGAELELHGAAFDHVPVMDRMLMRDLPETNLLGASELEKQALAAIAAVPGIPATIGGELHQSLLQQTLSVHGKACDLYGAGSLEAVATATSQIGKLLAYQRCNGIWTEVRPHTQLTSIVLGRLPAFWRLTAAQRAHLATVLSVLGSGQMPAELDSQLRSAVDACSALARARLVENGAAAAATPLRDPSQALEVS